MTDIEMRKSSMNKSDALDDLFRTLDIVTLFFLGDDWDSVCINMDAHINWAWEHGLNKKKKGIKKRRIIHYVKKWCAENNVQYFGHYQIYDKKNSARIRFEIGH